MDSPIFSFIIIQLMQCSNESFVGHTSLHLRLFLFMEVKLIVKLFIVSAFALKRVEDSSKLKAGVIKYD